MFWTRSFLLLLLLANHAPLNSLVLKTLSVRRYTSVRMQSFDERKFSHSSDIKVPFIHKYLANAKRSLLSTFVAAFSFSGSMLPKSAIAMASALTAFPSVSNAGIFRKYSNLSPLQKLATTPVFFLSNSGGNPYLQEDIQAGKPDQRIVTYFMSSDDANEYLNEIAQGNPANLNDFRVTTTSLEKVMKRIMQRKQSRKAGRYPMGTVLRIQPSKRQVLNADSLSSSSSKNVKVKKTVDGISIPMFVAEGLTVKRGHTGEVFVPYYFAYEDLLDDWARVSETEGKKALKVAVRDFRDVMCLSDGISTLTLANPTLNSKNDLEDVDKLLHSPAIIAPRKELGKEIRFNNLSFEVVNFKSFFSFRYRHASSVLQKQIWCQQ